MPSDFDDMGDGLVHVAQAVRCCSPTLRRFLLSGIDVYLDSDAEDYSSEKERLRVQWADVLAGVSACRELQVLVIPDIILEPLFPSGTALSRLTHLEISDCERKQPPDAGEVGLWELVASGGLPALAKLKVTLNGRWGGEEVWSRVAPALEAMAGTLTHLHLEMSCLLECRRGKSERGYELGVAVGKLRRLKDLALGLSQDGRTYHAFAQGLATSGGGAPSPPAVAIGGLQNRCQCRPAGEPAPPECAGLRFAPLDQRTSAPADGLCPAESGVQAHLGREAFTCNRDRPGHCTV
jgi:hypothetical protein